MLFLYFTYNTVLTVMTWNKYCDIMLFYFFLMYVMFIITGILRCIILHVLVELFCSAAICNSD